MAIEIIGNAAGGSGGGWGTVRFVPPDLQHFRAIEDGQLHWRVVGGEAFCGKKLTPALDSDGGGVGCVECERIAFDGSRRGN